MLNDYSKAKLLQMAGHYKSLHEFIEDGHKNVTYNVWIKDKFDYVFDLLLNSIIKLMK